MQQPPNDDGHRHSRRRRIPIPSSRSPRRRSLRPPWNRPAQTAGPSGAALPRYSSCAAGGAEVRRGGVGVGIFTGIRSIAASGASHPAGLPPQGGGAADAGRCAVVLVRHGRLGAGASRSDRIFFPAHDVRMCSVGGIKRDCSRFSFGGLFVCTSSKQKSFGIWHKTSGSVSDSLLPAIPCSAWRLEHRDSHGIV